MRIPNLILSTIILFISNLTVRVLGFLYKIFLSRIIGEAGLGIYHILFNFLMICLAIATTGIPTTLSCLIAKKKALKDSYSSNVLFISTLYIAFFISLLISLIIGFNSKYLSLKLLNNEKFYLFVLAICPAVIVITLSNVLRGYFYGIKSVVIPAVGQVLEQLVRICFFLLIIMYIQSESLYCYIALLGISIGEIANIIFITFCLYNNSDFCTKYTIDIKDFYNSSLDTIKMSIPITSNRMANTLLHSLSSMIVPSRLVLSGITYHQALSIYGIISGMVIPFVYLPFTLGSALVVNLIPSLSQEVALKNYNRIKLKINFSLLLTLCIGSLCSIFFYFFADKLCLLVFNNKLAGTYIKAMFLVPLFVTLNQTLSGILHSIGKEIISSLITISTMIIQLTLLYFLLPVPSINIYGYIYTMTSISILTCFIYVIVLIRYLNSLKFRRIQ